MFSTTSFSTSVLASYKDKDATKETTGYSRKLRVKENSLGKTVTPELEKQIVGESVGQRFILKQVLDEIIQVENKKYPLPLPSSLSVDQWRTLLSFTDRRARFFYLDSLLFGKKTLEEIKEFDEKITKPLQIPEEMIAQVVGDGEGDSARKNINTFLMFHELARQGGMEVPPELELRDLKQIAKINSKNGHKKYISFLNKRISMRLKDERLKSNSQANLNERVQAKKEAIEENDHIFYGLGQNTTRIRLSETNMKKELDWRVWREFALNSTPLVVDFSYLKNIKDSSKTKSLINREGIFFLNGGIDNNFHIISVGFAVKLNKEAKTPFPLYFTGVKPEIQEWMKKIYLIDENGSNFPVEITEKHQTELFPKERLVYLSPDSKNDLMEYDDDDIYVIGGIIDKGLDYSPLTLANAKRNKIRHARFPMKKTIGLTADLNVETCVAIMADMKYSNDWFYSLRWVPSRHYYRRVEGGGGSHSHKLAYRAHRLLTPNNPDGTEGTLSHLNPRQYRELYKQLIESNSREETNRIMQFLKK